MKRIPYLVGVVCLIALLPPACGPQPEQQAGPVAEKATDIDAGAVRTQIEEWADAWSRADLEKIVSVYAADGVRIPPNEGAEEGKDAIRASFMRMLDGYTVEPIIEIVDLRLSGDLAYVRSAYRVTLTPKEGGDPVRDNGNWVVVFQRQPDRALRVISDIWNSDNPLPEESTT
jgi:uncharacterized protein (TIGR02246 family)